VQWADRATPAAVPAETASQAAAPEAAGEEPQAKRRSRRPRRRDEEPAPEIAGAESAAATQVLERPEAQPASGSLAEVIEVGSEPGGDGDQPRKRGWWRRLIE
jgi:hypothetical protein